MTANRSPLLRSPRLRRFARQAALLACLLSLALLGACSSAPKKRNPVTVEVVVTASSKLNPDMNQRPSPAVVTVLKLKRAAPFLDADYFTLADETKGSLDGVVVLRDPFPIQPGATVRKSYTFDADEDAIGVMVGYRDMENSVWRAALDLPPQRKKWIKLPEFLKSGKPTVEYTVNLEERKVTLVGPPLKKN
ncbi:MAG: type VI secretion system-associated lipoprotein [Lysobacterales bacterium 69-70]|nr:type VI secretion system lipoprotein TssJ [Xanthomonadaceae bacterium]ODU32743.1 MAG: type VI secretion system-associated lipoprotein [Xanthomonadaceae bacterium SCN 69-320]ODV15676.1 MAG: type VI secretion system-associated lipoprotein [Xanthomonadaceae bacterium SCN 69-25]OJY99873.1 MAG: type VI secretion system-associated lipoprotein [Xanthomonadales bacterium 69-70]